MKNPEQLSRRKAIRYLVGLAALLPLSSLTNAPKEVAADTPYNWPKIHEMATNLQVAEIRPWAQKPVENMRKGLVSLEKVAEPDTERHREIIRLMESQEDKEGLSAYISLFEDLRGAMEHIRLEEQNPSYIIAGKNTANIQNIQRTLEVMTKLRATRKEVNLDDYYDAINTFIKEGVDFCDTRSPLQANNCQVIISMDRGIKPTVFGNIQFDRDEKSILEDLEAIPPYKFTCSEFELSSATYGERYDGQKISGPHGLFFSQKPRGSDLYMGHHIINMDPAPGLGRHTRRQVLLHEVGHGADGLVSEATAYRLTPIQLVEAMQLNQAATLHPDWGAHDKTLQQLFGIKPFEDLIPLLDANDEPVDCDTFVRIIRSYPVKRLLVPKLGLVENPDNIGFSFSLKPIRLIDFALGSPKPNHPNYQDIKKPANLKPWYGTLAAFTEDIMPPLREQANSGNIRANILSTGLGEYGSILARTEMVPEVFFKDFGTFVPGDKKDADTWWNYCNFVAFDALFYHLMVNGSLGGRDERKLLTLPEQKSGEKAVFNLRSMVQNETRAEGFAYDATLKDRVDPTNPYRMIRAQFGLAFNRN